MPAATRAANLVADPRKYCDHAIELLARAG
jgi:hypothetical protein